MSLSEYDTVLSVLPDRDVAEILEAERALPETMRGFVARLHGEMRADPEYTPVLHQFNRMGQALLSVALESTRHENSSITFPGFFVGQILGLRGLELATEQDIAPHVYRDVNTSYVAAQAFANKQPEVALDHSSSGSERDLRLAANHTKRAKSIAAYLSGEIDAALDLDVVSGYELELITRWAMEFAPDDPVFQEEIIDGYIFIRHRNQEIGDISPKDKDAFNQIAEELMGERIRAGKAISLGDFQADFVERFNQKNDIFDDVDMTNYQQVNSTHTVMDEVAKELFATQSEVKIYDTVHLPGPALFLFKKATDSTLGNFEFMMLDKGDHLRGMVLGANAAVVPKEKAIMPFLRAYIRTKKADRTFHMDERHRKIGPVVRLTDVSVVDAKGTLTEMPADMQVWIPMEYATSHLHKVVETDAA